LKPLERIGDFDVHPVASIFPMMSAKEYDDLRVSICDLGLQDPIVIHEGLLVDGRNRLKACLETERPFRTVEWSKIVAHHHLRTGNGGFDDFPETSIDQWIMVKNIARRSISDDQRAVLWAQHGMWVAEEEAKESQKASQFEKGKTGNAGGVPKSQADINRYPPDNTAEKNARSTVGKVAAAANVSHRKAAQVVKLVKAVEAGTAPKEDLELVKAGAKKLTDAVRPLRPEKAEKPEPTLRESVTRDIKRLMDRYAVANHEEVKQIIKEYLCKN